MMARTVLIAEDEQRLAGILFDYLRQAGYSPVVITDGLAVVPWVREHFPELILLDLMMPGRDGLEICREIRSFSSVPIIMTTARVEELDRLLGLELGADDYICKPFSPKEVVARVTAVLRRSGGAATVIACGLVLDEARHRAVLNDRELDLTAVEFKLLQLLAANPGRIFDRQQLMDNIYPNERVVADRTIDSHIKKLRKKIAAVCPETDLVHSVYGLGYKFEVNDASGK